MANAHPEPLPSTLPRYEDLSIHGPRDAFIPPHSPPPAYNSEEVQYGGRWGNQVGPQDPARGRPGPSAPLLGSTETIVITIDGYSDSGGHETTSETSRLLARNGRGQTEQRILGRSRRYGSVDNPRYEVFMRRYSATKSAIRRLNVFHALSLIPLLVVGLLSVVVPSSFTRYFGVVHLACALTFLTQCLVLPCYICSRATSFANKLTTLCAVLSVLVTIVSAFSTAQESTYFLTCKDAATAPVDVSSEITTAQIKCPDGIINPPFDFQNIMHRVIIQGSGCFLFVILSITFSVQMCLMYRFTVYRRVLNNV